MAPSPEEVRAFLAGTLDAARLAAVDAWLAALPEAEAERVLAEAGIDRPVAPIQGLADPARTAFVSDLPRSRLVLREVLGEGGMATVVAAGDRVLEREVALKVLRPRRVDEPLEAYHVREAAFRREAALTAGLEHPAIPPVHDVGRAGGLPAFTMKRLDGRRLDAVLREDGLSLAARMEILLRVAEAVAYAHSRGVVHRDLTPGNILVAGYGAVYVLDWGLAATSGTSDGTRVGTPAWMAPEQATAAPADPRMDVYALGALGCLALTGQGPDGGRALLHGPLPRALVAVVRRCLDDDPQRRYPDAAAVAAELRRWFADGLTLAQEATAWEQAWLRLRRSPRVRTSATVVAVTLAAMAAGWWWSDHAAEVEAAQRLERLAGGTVLDRPAAVEVALEEVEGIARQHPHLTAARELAARLGAARDLAIERERQVAVRDTLAGLLRRTRTLGPWADQVQAWRAAIRAAGLTMDAERVPEDVRRLTGNPLEDAVLPSLAFLWRAEKERGADHHAENTAALLAGAGPTPGWQALGRLLGISRFVGHDPVFCRCSDSEAVLAEPATTAIALAIFAPDERLLAAARSSMQQRPGDFWPLLAVARGHLAAGDLAQAERVALVASGVEPDSELPRSILAAVRR